MRMAITQLQMELSLLSEEIHKLQKNESSIGGVCR